MNYSYFWSIWLFGLIDLHAFVCISRLSWILSTQMVWQCQLCCLVGVCWWWQENLDTFGPMGMYWDDPDDRIPLSCGESHSFLSHLEPCLRLHIEACTCTGLPQGHLWLFKNSIFEKISDLKKNCKHNMALFTFHIGLPIVNILLSVFIAAKILSLCPLMLHRNMKKEFGRNRSLALILCLM